MSEKIKVVVYKASDWDFKKEKEFESAEEMLRWMKKTYYDWILTFKKGNEIELWIYDDYME